MMSENINTKDIIDNIKDNYLQLEKSIINELYLRVDNHPLTIGLNREKVWMRLFRRITPKKFAIRQGVFLIDSKKKVSKEVDIAIYDEQYTPYIFNYEEICFIPIEAVAVVVQCKSKSVEDNNVQEWLSNIDELKGELGGIARMATSIASGSPKTQKVTKPLSILCHLDNNKVPKKNYDLTIVALGDGLSIHWNEKLKKLKDIYMKVNGLLGEELINVDVSSLDIDLESLKVQGNSILSLIFQLNQVLMLINNPMLFPHKAYVNMFNK